MGLLTSVSIHIFPVLMLLVIYLNNHRKTSETADKRLFDLLTLLLRLAHFLQRPLAGGLEGKNGRHGAEGCMDVRHYLCLDGGRNGGNMVSLCCISLEV